MARVEEASLEATAKVYRDKQAETNPTSEFKRKGLGTSVSSYLPIRGPSKTLSTSIPAHPLDRISTIKSTEILKSRRSLRLKLRLIFNSIFWEAKKKFNPKKNLSLSSWWWTCCENSEKWRFSLFVELSRILKYKIEDYYIRTTFNIFWNFFHIFEWWF